MTADQIVAALNDFSKGLKVARESVTSPATHGLTPAEVITPSLLPLLNLMTEVHRLYVEQVILNEIAVMLFDAHNLSMKGSAA